jgi:hypothetical protein
MTLAEGRTEGEGLAKRELSQVLNSLSHDMGRVSLNLESSGLACDQVREF